jgi:RNA polymerase sigma-70 factor, ECF subfamily
VGARERAAETGELAPLQSGQHTITEEIVRARDGDLGAFESLVRRHEERVYSFLARWLGDQAAAADVLQETILAAFRNIKKFDARMAFRPWFFRIAVNAAKMHRRARLRDQRHRSEWEHAPIGPMPRSTVTAQLRAIATLEQGLGALSRSDRQLILLRFAEEMTVKEISQVLKTPEFVVKMRVHRARIRFRDAVRSAEEGRIA